MHYMRKKVFEGWIWPGSVDRPRYWDEYGFGLWKFPYTVSKKKLNNEEIKIRITIEPINDD